MAESDFDVYSRELRGLDPEAPFGPTDLLRLSAPLREAINTAMRNGQIKLSELSASLDMSLEHARQLADILCVKKLFYVLTSPGPDEVIYRVRMSSQTQTFSRKDILDKLKGL